MQIFERADVERGLPMSVCIDLMKRALRDLDRGLSRQLVRTGMGLPKGGLAYMPGVLSNSGTFGAKLISVYPDNAADGYPSHQGWVVLFEGAHGSPIALADAAAITEIRTAAASGAATDVLARRDAHVLAILGSGAQARTHLEAMRCVRELTEVHIWSPHRAHAERFADEVRTAGLPAVVHSTAEDAVRTADLICTVCRAQDPILRRDWVRPGAHINAVGACSAKTRELDSALVAASRLYVDDRAACEAGSGEYLIPLSEGMIDKEHIVGTIGQLLNGAVPGRRSAEEITVFDSLGLAIEDLACADYLAKR